MKNTKLCHKVIHLKNLVGFFASSKNKTAVSLCRNCFLQELLHMMELVMLHEEQHLLNRYRYV